MKGFTKEEAKILEYKIERYLDELEDIDTHEAFNVFISEFKKSLAIGTTSKRLAKNLRSSSKKGIDPIYLKLENSLSKLRERLLLKKKNVALPVQDNNRNFKETLSSVTKSLRKNEKSQ